MICFFSSSSIASTTPSWWLLTVGAPIVIGSGLYIWLRERQLSVKEPSTTQL